MLKTQITPREVVDFLNDLLEVDRESISKFFHKRTVVNEDLAGHPTVQVRISSNEETTIAALGLLNGLFGVDSDGWGAIYRLIEDDGYSIIKFGLVDNEMKGK